MKRVPTNQSEGAPPPPPPELDEELLDDELELDEELEDDELEELLELDDELMVRVVTTPVARAILRMAALPVSAT